MATRHLRAEAEVGSDAHEAARARGSAGGGENFNIALHGLRGVAALMVVWAHVLGGTAEHIYANADHSAAVAPWWNFGTHGVQLFFVISGFVILPSARRYAPSEFALRRALRLYPLFLALTVLFVALNAVTNAYPQLNDAGAVLAGLFFLNLFTGTEQLTPNAWSLSFEVWFYVLTALVVEAQRRGGQMRVWLAVVPAVAFALAFPITIFFLLGVGIRLLHERGLPLPPSAARVLEAAILPVWIFTASRAHFEYVWADFAHPAAASTAAVTGLYVYLAAHERSLTARLLGRAPLLWVGTISYSLYLVHPYIYLPLRLVFDRAGVFDGGIAGPVLLFGTAVTLLSLAASALANRTLERWPYERFFRQGVYRLNPKVAGDASQR